MFTELMALMPLAEAAAETVQQTGAREYLGLGLAVGLGLAALGGSLGQGRAVAGATEAVSRQPDCWSDWMSAAALGLQRGG